MTEPFSKVAIFDRDGTVNVEHHYLSRPEQIALLPGAAEGMRLLQRRGYRLVIVTNQSGIARGYFDETRLDEIHRQLLSLLAAEGVSIAGIYTCPHHPDAGCACRKPKPGLVHQAARELGFAPEESLVFGDKSCDIALGRRVGATTVLVATGHGSDTHEAGEQADIFAPSIADAVNALFEMSFRP